MAEYQQALLENDSLVPKEPSLTNNKPPRVASLDVFRGVCVFLMMLVDYGGSIFPIIAHSPWNGLHLADFVMPFFLFIAGVSLALVYKKVPNRADASWKAALRATKLFFLGVFLQGGYFHGINSMTYGVDLGKIRWLGILQRISIGYVVAALCEIWLPRRTQRASDFVISYYLHWLVAFSLSAVYLSLLYGLYVPDWKFEPSTAIASLHTMEVNCSVRGDLGPACNAAGMIDRYIIGLNHLYTKPVYRNLKECNMTSGQVPDTSPSWCHAPADPEGVLSSLTAAVTCIIGLQYGHILAHLQGHKERMQNWSLFSVSLLLVGFLLAIGIPVNKSLYTVSYMLITSAAAGTTFLAFYLLVDVYGYRCATTILEWMGKHSLSIFVIITSNLAVIAIQGFYWSSPENNIIHAIVSCFVQR